MNCFSNNKELNDEKQIKLDCRLGKGGGFNIKMCTERILCIKQTLWFSQHT